jgi:hypothetical protein
MIVVGLIGVVAAFGSPLMDRFMVNLRTKAAARDVADSLRLARAEAIRSGVAHIVFFSAAASGDPPATDPAGNALGADPSSGGPFPIFTLQDDDGDCTIGAGERQMTVAAKRGVAWGSTVSGGAIAPGDAGLTNHDSGSSFRTAAGAGVTWVMFQPNGIPVSFDSACNVGALGTGGGAIYLTNGTRDYAIVMSPLGAVRVHAWELGEADWTD